MDKKRILVVDYEPKALDRLVSLIPADKYEISTAKDGIAALEEYDKFKPELVFLRTMLPKKHGFQVCQEMIERDKSVPIIMHCSIYKGRKYKADAVKIYGATDYLEDPIDPKVIIEILNKFLGSTPQKKEQPKGSIKEEVIEMPKISPSQTPKAKGLDIDKALEETLSGLKGVGAPRKKETPKVEETVPISELLPQQPPIKEELKIEEKVEEPKVPEKIEGIEKQVTSEEIFGDVIKKVEERISHREAEPQTSPKIDISKVLGEEKVKEEVKAEPIQKEKIEEKIEIPSIPIPKPKKAVSEIDKKLEETLAGVKLKPQTTKKSVEEQKVEIPIPEKKEEKIPEIKEKVKPVEKPKVEEKVELKEEIGQVEKEKEKEEIRVEEAPKVPEEGIPFGQYRLLEKVAMGGMAELFKAKQVGLEGFQRIVAVKRILPHLASNSDFVTMFIDEAKLAAQLNHPNIVHIYDLGKADDSYFIAMEFVEGRDLRSILKESENLSKTMPLPAAIYIAKKICSALHCAHTAKDSDGKPMKLVHRDVSPQNILISTSGEVKLVDFGIAKAVSKASHTQTGALKGKLLYMSPEQAWGKTIDGRSDLFSLGVVLFEMLTGKKLFYGDSEMSILERVREAKLPDFEQFREQIPPQLEKILKKALEKDPDRRFRDGRSFETEIDKFARSCGFAPTAYYVIEFLTTIFPSIYSKDRLDSFIREKEEAEAEFEQIRKSQEEERIKKEEEEKKKVETLRVPEEEKEEEKPKPKFQVQKPKPQPPKPIRIPPPKKEPEVEKKKEEVVSAFEEEPQEGKKKGLIIGGAVAAVVVILILVALIFGGKKAPTPADSANAKNPPVTQTPSETQKPVEPTTPPEIKPEVPPPPQNAESPEDIKKAKDEATSAIKNLEEVLSNIDKNQGSELAPQAVESLKKSKGNIDRLFRNAKSIGEFNAITKAASQLTDNSNKTLNDVVALKQQKEQEKAKVEEEAKKKAEEEKRKQEEQARKSEQPQETKIQKGDFVALPDLAEGERPKLITKVEANYTSLARQNKAQGTIYVELTIDENGKVTNAQVVKGFSPDYGLNDECVKASLQWRFTPALKNGVPVKTKVTYPISFRLK